MELPRLNEALKEIAEERARIQDEKEVLTDKLTELDKSLLSLTRAESSLRDLLGAPSTIPISPEPTEERELVFPPTMVYPRTTDAVYEVLRENEGKRLTVRSIEAKLLESGRLKPGLSQPYGTVQDAARRLAVRKAEIHRLKRSGKVTFTYRSKDLPSSPGERRSSEGGGL